MSVALHELLQPQVVLKVVSRIAPNQNRLSRWLGWQPDRFNEDTVTLSGPNTINGAPRYASFRYFDLARTVPIMKAPGTGPVAIAPNPTGDATVKCARFHMKISLLAEELGNLSPIIGPNSQIDPGGQDYVKRQTMHLTRRFHNGIELMATGMMQDNLYVNMIGDRWWPQIGPLTAGQVGFQIPFQIPAGNKNQLNMLGGGNLITQTWNNVAAPILQQCMAVEAAFAQLTGYDNTDNWINQLLWYNIITNNDVRNTAGSSQTPFAEFDWTEDGGLGRGAPTTQRKFTATLRGYPNLRWNITNHVLVLQSDIDPSYSTAPASAQIIKVVPDGMCFFCTEPSSEWEQLYQGGEHVVENPGMPMVLRMGYWFWKEWTTQPSGLDLLGVLNCVPTLFIPKCIAPAQVIF